MSSIVFPIIQPPYVEQRRTARTIAAYAALERQAAAMRLGALARQLGILVRG